MMNCSKDQSKLSIIIPCFNERNTLEKCVEKVLSIKGSDISLEVIIVDDCSNDGSLEIAQKLAGRHFEILVLHHEINQGKGAALRTGFSRATGDFVAVQDADLEYDPNDLKRLIIPLKNDEADVVFGSRFLSVGAHRVLYFWHSMGNKFLTFLSNMFTDMNLTDMETCYKVFKREIIQNINIEENRFGFEPEIIAKIAHMRFRVFEMGISYYGRTYEEGKKIGVKDGFRALYCILRYNAHHAPIPVQFFLYLFIGCIVALANLILYLSMVNSGLTVNLSAPISFVLAAAMNYFLCILLLFRHKARWNSLIEVMIYWLVVLIVAIIDLFLTKILLGLGLGHFFSKFIASTVGLWFNFLGCRFFVFPESKSGSWKAQYPTLSD